MLKYVEKYLNSYERQFFVMNTLNYGIIVKLKKFFYI